MPAHLSAHTLDLIIMLKGINYVPLPETDASPDHTVGTQNPTFIPGHGFELRFGGFLRVWVVTQGCASSSHPETS